MKRKWTEALSPVRKQSLFIDKMVAVCLMLPQWTEWKVRTEKVNGYRETKKDHLKKEMLFGKLAELPEPFLCPFTHPWPGISEIS